MLGFDPNCLGLS